MSGSTPDPKQPEGGLTLEQQVQWVALYTAGNFVYLYSKGQNALRAKKGKVSLFSCALLTKASINDNDCITMQRSR